MADFVIIGGGVYGVAVAHWLTENGGDVRLLEARGIGNGASAGPGRRGTRANGRDLRELPLIRIAHEMWPTLHERLGVAPFFERTGHLQLIEREQDLAPCAARAALQNRLGTVTHVLDAGAVHDLEPGLSSNIIGALYCPLDGASDHTAATAAFAGAAQKGGAEISTNTRVDRIVVSGGRVAAVETACGERVEVGRRLFILANAGVEHLVADRIELPVWSRTFQVLLTAPGDGAGPRHLIGHASRTLALKAEPGNRVMISGGLPGNWDALSERGSALAASIEANLADAIAVYPALAGTDIEVADADHLEASAIDNIPVIDLLPGTDNAVYATGWCGHGWAIAPAVTRMLAQWGETGVMAPLLAPFSHARFGMAA